MVSIPMTDPYVCYIWCSMDPIKKYPSHVSINIPDMDPSCVLLYRNIKFPCADRHGYRNHKVTTWETIAESWPGLWKPSLRPNVRFCPTKRCRVLLPYIYIYYIIIIYLQYVIYLQYIIYILCIWYILLNYIITLLFFIIQTVWPSYARLARGLSLLPWTQRDIFYNVHSAPAMSSV